MAKTRQQIEDTAFDTFNKKMEISKLEKFYVEATLDDLEKIIEEKKEEVVNKLVKFQNNYINVKVDKYGNEEKIVNPYLISTYFFKTINPVSIKEPLYSADKLAIVWNLYMYLIEQVNMEIAPFSPTLSHFCKFAGISLTTFNKYKSCGDEDMMVLCSKISDETMNGNFALAQNKVLSEKSTLSRLKVENQIVEKPQPKVVVNLTEEVPREILDSRISKYKQFMNKKG